jgi:hypothetical protein
MLLAVGVGVDSSALTGAEHVDGFAIPAHRRQWKMRCSGSAGCCLVSPRGKAPSRGLQPQARTTNSCWQRFDAIVGYGTSIPLSLFCRGRYASLAVDMSTRVKPTDRDNKLQDIVTRLSLRWRISQKVSPSDNFSGAQPVFPSALDLEIFPPHSSGTSRLASLLLRIKRQVVVGNVKAVTAASEAISAGLGAPVLSSPRPKATCSVCTL